MPRIRLVLALAALWDLVVGARVVSRSTPGDAGRADRVSGAAVLVFAVFFGVAALRPTRRMLTIGVAAKGVGAASGAVNLARGRLDRVTWSGLADGPWIPVLLAVRRRL